MTVMYYGFIHCLQGLLGDPGYDGARGPQGPPVSMHCWSVHRSVQLLLLAVSVYLSPVICWIVCTSLSVLSVGMSVHHYLLACLLLSLHGSVGLSVHLLICLFCLSPIQFSLAFFMHLLMLLFLSLYFSNPSGSNRFFLSSLLLSHRSRISSVIQGFFF